MSVIIACKIVTSFRKASNIRHLLLTINKISARFMQQLKSNEIQCFFGQYSNKMNDWHTKFWFVFNAYVFEYFNNKQTPTDNHIFGQTFFYDFCCLGLVTYAKTNRIFMFLQKWIYKLLGGLPTTHIQSTFQFLFG